MAATIQAFLQQRESDASDDDRVTLLQKCYRAGRIRDIGVIAHRLEHALYCESDSMEAYRDMNTFKQRLQAIATRANATTALPPLCSSSAAAQQQWCPRWMAKRLWSSLDQSRLAFSQREKLLKSALVQRGCEQGRRVGAYPPQARRARVAWFHEKRKLQGEAGRNSVRYNCRKVFANTRFRNPNGRFMEQADEVLLRELVSMI